MTGFAGWAAEDAAAAGVGEVGKVAGALLVLGINVVMLMAGGTSTLLAQRALNRRTIIRNG
jgi:hypothetical protein